MVFIFFKRNARKTYAVLLQVLMSYVHITNQQYFFRLIDTNRSSFRCSFVPDNGIENLNLNERVMHCIQIQVVFIYYLLSSHSFHFGSSTLITLMIFSSLVDCCNINV